MRSWENDAEPEFSRAISGRSRVIWVFIKKGEILTSKGKYCLNGITRGKAIQICRSNDIPCSEEDFTFDDIADCDEAFVTGTFAGIIPVAKIEDRNLQSTNSDSLVNEIRILYNQHIHNYINSK